MKVFDSNDTKHFLVNFNARKTKIEIFKYAKTGRSLASF